MTTLRDSLSNIRDSFYHINSSTNSTCPLKPAQWCIHNSAGTPFCIQKPSLIPTCILALLIGLICSKRIARLPGKFSSRYYYQTAFFLYGIMMTSAGILHCFIGDQVKSSTISDGSGSFLQLFVTVIDVGLTSNIAITILFCGLCDVNFLNPNSSITRILLFVIYFIVFFLWTCGLLFQWKWIFNILYVGIVSICGFTYLLTQLCIKANRRALPILIVAGIYGAAGLAATTFAANRICSSEGPFWSLYIGPEFLWFLFSDIAMAFIYGYVVRVNQENPTDMRRYTIDLEKYPEKPLN